MYGISASCNASNGRNLVLETISLGITKCFPPPSVIRSKRTNITHLRSYKGRYVLVVDGSIPLKDNGIYCMVAGEPIVDHIRKAAEAQQRLSLSVPALRGAVLPQLELTQLAQSACKKFCQAKPLSIFRAARRTRTTSSRPLRTSSLTANRRNWMTKSSDLRLWPSDSRTLQNVARTSMLVVLPKSSVMKATVKAGACTTSAVKGQKLTATAQRCNSAMLAACGR